MSATRTRRRCADTMPQRSPPFNDKVPPPPPPKKTKKKKKNQSSTKPLHQYRSRCEPSSYWRTKIRREGRGQRIGRSRGSPGICMRTGRRSGRPDPEAPYKEGTVQRGSRGFSRWVVRKLVWNGLTSGISSSLLQTDMASLNGSVCTNLFDLDKGRFTAENKPTYTSTLYLFPVIHRSQTVGNKSRFVLVDVNITRHLVTISR